MTAATFPDRAAWLDLPAGRVLDALIAEALGWRWFCSDEPDLPFRFLAPPPGPLGDSCVLLKSATVIPCGRTGADGRYPLMGIWDLMTYRDAGGVRRVGFPRFSTSWEAAGELVSVAAPALGAAFVLVWADCPPNQPYWRANVDMTVTPARVVTGVAYGATGPEAISKAFLRFALYKGLLV